MKTNNFNLNNAFRSFFTVSYPMEQGFGAGVLKKLVPIARIDIRVYIQLSNMAISNIFV